MMTKYSLSLDCNIALSPKKFSVIQYINNLKKKKIH